MLEWFQQLDPRILHAVAIAGAFALGMWLLTLLEDHDNER
jgi:hypothetical protein